MNIDPSLPQVYFRLDHAGFIGEGHLFRSKALAFEMQKLGFSPIFITRPNTGFDLNKFSPFQVITLSPQLNNGLVPSNYADWLGTTEKDDATECLDLINQSKGNIWIIDHYGIGATWEEIMSNRGQFIVSIDDLSRIHNSQIIIDHNLTADKNRYINKNENGLYLMGPQFALLREDICNAIHYDFSKPKDSYLLALGSAEESLFLKILSILREFQLKRLILLNAPQGFTPHKNEFVMPFCTDLPELYRNQKIVFGSCGVAHLERMALNVPSVTCVIVDNQIEVGRKTEQLGCSFHLGDLRTLSNNELRSKLNEVISNPEQLQRCAKVGSQIISLTGTQEIAKNILLKFKDWQCR